MVLSKIFALLICSVVIASGSSCDNDGNVTAQDVKFLEATGGFFYIHGLTNGESVVMFQTLGDSKIQVQYTFINDDCLYETRSYNIHENGNMKDHVKVVKTRDEFSISKTLFYMGQKYSFVNGSVSRYNFKAEIKFEINKTGYVFDNDTEDHLFRTIYSEKKKEELDPLDVCENAVDLNELSGFEIIVKDNFELTYMKNGSYFYQSYELVGLGSGSFRSGSYESGSYGSGSGSYAFKTSNGFHVVDYNIKRVLFEKTSIYKLSYNVKDDEDLRVYLEANFQDKKEFVYLCFNSTGLSIAEVPDISGGFGGPPGGFSAGGNSQGASDFGFGGQAPSHESSRAGIEMVGDKITVSE